MSGVLANRALEHTSRTATEAGERAAIPAANGVVAIGEMADKSRAHPGGTPEHDENGEES